MAKQERPVKAETLDKRDQNRAANRQKRPYTGSDISKFDKRTRLTDRGQYPK
jgi:hypothetical protein